MKKHLSIDIETLGADPVYDAAIIAIGAVVFTKDEIINTIDIKIDPVWTPGGRNQDTYEWWMRQFLEDAARSGATFSGRAMPWEACGVFTSFVMRYAPDYVWGYPARFDVGHLRQLYKAVGMPFPIIFRAERDLSTLRYVARGDEKLWARLKEIKESNEKPHDALSDAISQTLQIQACLNHFGLE